MTEEEVAILLLEFMKARGGVVTERQIDEVAEILERHFPCPKQTSLNQARMVLGLPLLPDN